MPGPFLHHVDAIVVTVPALAGGLLAFLFIICLRCRLRTYETGKDIGHPKIDKLALQVKNGARRFLIEEYRVLAIFIFSAAGVLFGLFTVSPITPGQKYDGAHVGGAFLVGAFLSASAGWLGMLVATDGNVRTTAACTKGTLNDGLRVAFTTGAVMGFAVVGLGLTGLSIVFILLSYHRNWPAVMQQLSGFGFGASSIALFARVAGGIYTKAADVGADLVGKVEAGIDEDDPHNPAVIADNVGDNVGDVAGMGADLFESYVGSIIASASLACQDHDPEIVSAKIALPFWIAGAGIFCSFLGYFAVSTKEKGEGWSSSLSALMWALEKGMYLAGFLFIIAAAFCTVALLGANWEGWMVYACIITGLVSGMVIGKITEYFTSFDYGPVISIKDRGTTGPATVVIQGLGVGMISCVPPVIVMVAAIMICATISGLYGVSIAAVGMLSTLGITLATDAYGPVADNAGGLAEMDPSIPKEVRDKTDALDALGNTTAATGKGFAIGSAVLTSLSLLAAFQKEVDPNDEMDFTVSDPMVLSGILIGAMLPFLFAALTMISVGKAAAEIIQEVRRQFHGGVPGLFECIKKASAGEDIPESEDVLPDSDRCVAISTRSSVREMIAPGAFAVLTPLVIGFTAGPRCLVGLLAGSIASGCMMAIMMSNAGGAWDNSKKLCEKLKIKKTDQGKACIVGDTVGDPFKDTSGPALNILIKLMSMVSLTIAPFIQDRKDWEKWYFGLAPLTLMFLITFILYCVGILTWEDPLNSLNNDSAADVDGSAQKIGKSSSGVMEETEEFLS